MFCTNTGKKALILLFTALLLIAILAVHASAYTPPYRLMVFTDKQVYLDYSFIWTNPPTINTASTLDTTRGTFEQRVNLFVVLLDSDGNIVRGIPASNITAALRDKERWNHSGPGLDSYPYYTPIPTNGYYYSNISFPVFTDTDNAMKISKHYPGSVFLNEMVFSGSVSCSICHKNSLVANTDLVGYPNSSKADDIDVSHYGTRQYLLNTTMNLKRCQECHGVKVKGSYSTDYGNARSVPEGHNNMGSTPVDCEWSCHNSAIDVNNYSIPVIHHNNSVGVYLGSDSCNSPGCHTPPEPGEETR